MRSDLKKVNPLVFAKFGRFGRPRSLPSAEANLGQGGTPIGLHSAPTGAAGSLFAGGLSGERSATVGFGAGGQLGRILGSVFFIRFGISVNFSKTIIKKVALRAIYILFRKNSPDLGVSENRSRNFHKKIRFFSSKKYFFYEKKVDVRQISDPDRRIDELDREKKTLHQSDQAGPGQMGPLPVSRPLTRHSKRRAFATVSSVATGTRAKQTLRRLPSFAATRTRGRCCAAASLSNQGYQSFLPRRKGLSGSAKLFFSRPRASRCHANR